MCEVLVRVAYIGIDNAGRATVMVSNNYQDPERPGWRRGVTQRFIHAKDEEEMHAIAARLKTSGTVDMIKPI